MEKRKKLRLSLFLTLIFFSQKALSPTSSPITVREIQQRLLTIKRSASNLEQVLRKNKTSEGFYAAPQTPIQLMELHEAARDLITASKYFHPSA